MPKIYKCNFCPKEFRDRSGRVRHRANIHPETLKKQPARHICDTCGKSYLYESQLKKHIKFHLKKLKEFKCDFCMWSFDRKGNLISHLALKHPEKMKKQSTTDARNSENNSLLDKPQQKTDSFVNLEKVKELESTKPTTKEDSENNIKDVILSGVHIGIASNKPTSKENLSVAADLMGTSKKSLHNLMQGVSDKDINNMVLDINSNKNIYPKIDNPQEDVLSLFIYGRV